ncbi:MAG: cyclic nucleotide-binding domain-containing protein [Sphingomonadaceae bacterium]
MKRVDLLRSTEVFRQVSQEDLQRIAGLLVERQVNKGAVICRQGDVGDALYFVVSGRILAAAADPTGGESVLGVFSEGQYFGEMALLTGERSPATMRALTDAGLLVLRKEDFDLFQAGNVQVMLQMMKVMAQLQAVTLQRQAAQSEESGQKVGSHGRMGKLFTVFSPKGGVGKSTLAVNLAVALAQEHPDSVALLDLSLTFGHAALLLNLTPKLSLSGTNADSLQNMGMEDGLRHYLSVHPSSSLRLLVGATRPEEGEAVTGEMARAAIQQLRRHFAFVVVDTESCFTDPVLAALESSDRILLLCSPEVSSLRDARECQRILNDVMHIPSDRSFYLLNRLFPYKTLTKEQIESTLQRALSAELPYGGDAPTKAALRGETLVETQPGSSLARAIRGLARDLAGGAPRADAASGQAKKRGFFR